MKPRLNCLGSVVSQRWSPRSQQVAVPDKGLFSLRAHRSCGGEHASGVHSQRVRTNGVCMSRGDMAHDDQAVVAACHNEEDGVGRQLLNQRGGEQAGRPVRAPHLPHLIVTPAPHLVAA